MEMGGERSTHQQVTGVKLTLARKEPRGKPGFMPPDFWGGFDDSFVRGWSSLFGALRRQPPLSRCPAWRFGEREAGIYRREKTN